MTRRYLSPADIATALGISRRGAYRLVQDLPRVKIGRSVRVAEDDLDAYLKARTTRPREGPWSKPPAVSTTSAPPDRPGWLRPLRARGAKHSG